MTQSIPNGFSAEDLQRMLAEARPEPSEECTGCPDCDDSIPDEYADQIMKVADKYLDMATNEVQDPMVHKAMLVLIIGNFIRFHNKLAEVCLEDGMNEQAFAWARDAGKFQAMHNILSTIVCGDKDFLAPDA